MAEEHVPSVRETAKEIIASNKGCVIGATFLTLAGMATIYLTQMLASSGENLMQLFEQAPEALLKMITITP